MSDKPLTPKQEAFATGVASGLSQAEAYRQAFPQSRKWTDKTVHEKASRLAAEDKVQARIQELRGKAAEANEVTIERIVAEVVKIAFANQRDLMTWGPQGVKLRASDELTDEQAAYIGVPVAGPYKVDHYRCTVRGVTTNTTPAGPAPGSQADFVASVMAAVQHAEVVAHRVGEPFGALILALAVTDSTMFCFGGEVPIMIYDATDEAMLITGQRQG